MTLRLFIKKRLIFLNFYNKTVIPDRSGSHAGVAPPAPSNLFFRDEAKDASK